MGISFIEERLHRVVASASWQELFPNATVTHLLWASSDHLPILLDLDTNIIPPIQRSSWFCFEAMWVRDNSCSAVVRDC